MSDLTTTAQDTTLELAVRTQTFTRDLVERMQARLSDDRGQTAAEYMGILLIVGTVIAAIISLNLHTRVAGSITEALNKMGAK